MLLHRTPPLLIGNIGAFAVSVILLASFSLHASENIDTDFFERKIRPIFSEHCIQCHGEKKQKGGLRLDSKAGWEKGGETGPAIIPRKSKESLLVRMILGENGKAPQMPPEDRLSKDLSDALVTWIDSGAPDPRNAEIDAAKTIDWKAAGEFWSFKPVAVQEPPMPKDAHLTQPIDKYVAAKLDEAGLKPVAAGDRRTLLRRASFDLTGLPPTEEQVRAFEADASPEAFAKVIDRLLASPQYGEQQARAWLDLARYGEDQSDKEGDEGKIAHAFRYRDWVIQAFNKDVPYDRFIKLQLAADLMEDANSDPTDRRALGFMGLGAIYARPNDLDRKKAEEWDDRIDTLTRSFLGLTVSCARCHDHKYDPIPTQDYYSLTGIIANTKNAVLHIAPKDQTLYDEAKKKLTEAEQSAKDFLQIEIDRMSAEKAEQFEAYAIAAWNYNALKLDKPDLKFADYAKTVNLDGGVMSGIDRYLRVGGGRSKKLEKWPDLLPKKDGPREAPPEVKELAAEFQRIVKENLAKPYKQRHADIMGDLFGADKGTYRFNEKKVLESASAQWKAKYAPYQESVKFAKTALPPEPPQCNGVVEESNPKDLKVYIRGNPARQGELAPRRFLRILAGSDAPKFTHGSGRLELAEAIADPKNPLTARVMANRIWQQHFGRGIVGTPSNFGRIGERPTHPELLDYLASQFMKNGWSVKTLHREIMLSATYQRGSAPDAKNETSDPEDRLLWRVNRRRLTIEAFRDTVLAISGNLDLSPATASAEIDDLKNVRRTVYGKVSRFDLSPLLRLFDFPAPNISSDRRSDTTLPQQALFALNSPFMQAQAKLLAARVATEASPTERIRKAYELALLRQPSESETARTIKFLTAQDPPTDASKEKKNSPTPPSRLERFAQVLLASNELFYVD